MRKHKFLALIRILSMVFSMLAMAPAMPAKADEISEITATMNPADLTSICQLDAPITYPAFTMTSTNSAKVESGSVVWQRNGVDVGGGDTVFVSGKWHLLVPVIINTTESADTFAESPVLEVNETSWTLDRVLEDPEDHEHVAWFYSPEIDLTDGKVNFVKDPGWDIGISAVGVPITPFSVKSGVSGGSGNSDNYWFEKISGPDWLDINHTTGEISGTPSHQGINSPLKVKVTDSWTDPYQSDLITIDVDYTMANTNTPVFDVNAGAVDLKSLVIKDTPAKPLNSFPISDPAGVNYVKDESFWQKYDAETDSWNTISADTNFEAGEAYRYVVKIAADKNSFCFGNTRLYVEDYPWDRLSIDHEGCTAAFVSDPVCTGLETVSVVGVHLPVVGETPSVDGFSFNEKHILDDSVFWEWKNGEAWEDCGSDPFEAGKIYRVRMIIYSIPPYTFADSVTATVNGLGAAAKITSVDKDTLELTCPLPFAVNSSNLYVVTAGALNVRDGASYGATRIGGLKYGDVVLATQQSSGWVKIDYEGKENAWVKAEYLALTYTYETAIKPLKYTVKAGALNVRSTPSVPSSEEPDNRIGSYTAGKVILATGRVVGLDSEKWLVVDYNGQLGFVMAKYAETEEVATEESAEENETTEDLIVHTGGVPAKVTIVARKAAVAVGKDVTLDEEKISGEGDGYVTIVVYPDDARNFKNLTVDKISVPAEERFIVVQFSVLDDGSISIKLGPKNPATLTFESDGGSAVISQTVSKGETVEKPEDPVKKGYVFTGWYKDAELKEKYDFSAPVQEDLKIYAGWEAIVYTFSRGGDGTFTKGSAAAFELTVNRSVDDASTFSHFDSIEIDGTKLDAANYTAASGSLKASISGSFLATLPAGNHTLKVLFDDGSAETNLTIAEAPEESSDSSEAEESSADSKPEESSDSTAAESSADSAAESSQQSSTPESSQPEKSQSTTDTSSKDKNPNTGDGSHMVLWTLVLLISLMGIAALVWKRSSNDILLRK